MHTFPDWAIHKLWCIMRTTPTCDRWAYPQAVVLVLHKKVHGVPVQPQPSRRMTSRDMTGFLAVE